MLSPRCVSVVVTCWTALTLAGCWSTARDVDSGVDAYAEPARPSLQGDRVVVENFDQLGLETVHHALHVTRGGAVHGTSTAEPASHDLSRHVASALRAWGFRDASYQPGDVGRYRVRGHVDRWEISDSSGRRTWRVVGTMLQALTFCLVPMYFQGADFEAMVHTEIYDGEHRPLKKYRAPVVWTAKSTCYLGVRGRPATSTVGLAVGNVVARQVRDFAERASTGAGGG